MDHWNPRQAREESETQEVKEPLFKAVLDFFAQLICSFFLKKETVALL